jgi:hypothetical protein
MGFSLSCGSLGWDENPEGRLDLSADISLILTVRDVKIKSPDHAGIMGMKVMIQGRSGCPQLPGSPPARCQDRRVARQIIEAFPGDDIGISAELEAADT